MEIDNKEASDLSLDEQLTGYKTRLLPFAYNIVGDSMEAEDIVQDTLNKFFLNHHEEIIKPFNYLVKSVINKAINHKNLLRTRMETYPGEWLPVPVYTEETIYEKADQKPILNYSLLVLMEKLKPAERAVFILKETFDYSHQDIAAFLEISTENSRQLLKRAKLKLQPKPETSISFAEEHENMLQQLSDAISQTDVEKVKTLLSEDINAISDGGPKVSAARNILIGEKRVGLFLKALWHKYLPGATKKFVYVNHEPALIFSHGGKIFRCMIFEIVNAKISNIYIIVNPDKLHALNIMD